MTTASYELTPKGMLAAAECIHGHQPPPRAPRRQCRQCTRDARARLENTHSQEHKSFAGWTRFYSFYEKLLTAWVEGCSCRLCSIVDQSECGNITRQEERQLLVLSFESIGADHGDAAYAWGASAAHPDTGNAAGRHSLPPDRLLRKSP